MDPFYPTNKNPLEISYRDYIIMMFNNPQLIDTPPGDICCACTNNKSFYMPIIKND